VSTEWQQSVLDPIEALIGEWEERGESAAVSTLLPAWRANAGLTDGWWDVLDAMHAVPDVANLPPEERATLEAVADRIEAALRNRR
jgi:hypothetical protein